MAVFICMIMLAASFCYAGTVTLAWDAPDSGPTPEGYKIYYGLVSGEYTEDVDVGNVLEYTITGLDPALRYYYMATAYIGQGEDQLECDPSVETNWCTNEDAKVIEPTNLINIIIKRIGG
jgi:hypothetical protein